MGGKKGLNQKDKENGRGDYKQVNVQLIILKLESGARRGNLHRRADKAKIH